MLNLIGKKVKLALDLCYSITRIAREANYENQSFTAFTASFRNVCTNENKGSAQEL